MTVGLFSSTWLDIIKSAIVDLHQNSTFRAGPRLGSAGIDMPAFGRQADEIKRTLLENLDLHSGLERINRITLSKRADTRKSRLLDSIAAGHLSLDTVLEIQPALQFTVTPSPNGGTEVTFASKALQLPRQASAVIAAIVDKRVFSARSLTSLGLDDESVLVISRRLLNEGFLTVAN
jgi:hypothetical protein